MRNKLGNILMLTGIVLICAAFALLMYNRAEARRAEQTIQQVLPEIVHQVEESIQTNKKQPVLPTLSLEPVSTEMTETTINGQNYIGYLTLPDLDLVLPVLSDWDYKKLQISPCRYVGSTKSDDLVLMAHNYPKHFGKLSDLRWGSKLSFTDMDGIVTNYEVVSKDILAPDAVEEMTSGDFDLTLFTCTYGGKSRVTVYCDKEK